MIRYLALLLLFVSLCAPGASGQQSAGLIWDQSTGGKDVWGPSQIGRDPVYPPVNSEMADDFDLTGSVAEISVRGYNGHIGAPHFPPPFYGVHVRFYAAGQDGKPGALQAEYFRAADDPNLKTDFVVPGSFRMTLDPPFQASGRHFVSVQADMDPVFQAYWYWWAANSGAPRGAGAWFRNNLAQPPVWTRQFSYAEMNSDLAMALFGTRVTPVPRLTQVSPGSVPLSGRIKITGEGFGFNRENSVVTVGDQEALITRWGDNEITAYVAESTPLGAVEVKVITAGGTSNPLPLQVTARSTEGRVRWRFLADGFGVYAQPVVGPDGSVYAADVRGHLYALSADGGLKWIYNSDMLHAGMSLDLGPDGTVYMSSHGVLIAVGPDGEERWRVREPTGEPIFAGPSVGPDGNVYAVSNDLAGGGGLGLFCVNPQGVLLWNRPGFRGSAGWYWGGQEIRFGNGQLYFTTQNNLTAYTLAGVQRWARPGSGQCAVGIDGTVYVNVANQAARIAAYGPDGSARGSFSKTSLPPVPGPDGSVYAADGEWLEAYDRLASARWRTKVAERVFEPAVSPVNTLIVAPGQTEFGAPAFLDGISISGAPLWRLLLPMEGEAPVLPVSRPCFSADGETVYVGMTGNQYTVTDASWLYAVDTALEPGAELPFLTIRPERVGGGFTAGGVVTLPEPAGPGGATVSLSSNVDAATVPATVQVLPGLRGAAFTVSTRAVAEPTVVTVTATHSGESHPATLTVVPPGPEAVTLERWDADSGDTFSGTVHLNGPAPAKGLKVTLTSSSSLVDVPESVTVPAGEKAANFPISVAAAIGQADVLITASANGMSASAELWVWGLWLEDIYVEPNPVVGGREVKGTLVLSGLAPAGGLTVFLESDNPGLLTVPASVVVPAGKDEVTFSGQTAAVEEATFVDLWAFTEEDEIGTWVDLLPAGAGDEVVVESATVSSKGQLTVEATSSSAAAAERAVGAAARRRPSVTLTVYDSAGKLIGTLKNGKKGRYKGRFKLKTRPDRITVRSSRGGAATRAVSGG